MQLFGFESSVAQELFDALLTVSGVGPRSAMAVLSELPPVEVYSAVVNEDDAAFRRVSGIGPKTAKLIVVSLAGRLAGLDVLGISSSQTATAHSGSQRAESTSETIVRALTGLGWPERIAREAVTSVVAVNPSADSAVILREALAALSSARNLS